MMVVYFGRSPREADLRYACSSFDHSSSGDLGRVVLLFFSLAKVFSVVNMAW